MSELSGMVGMSSLLKRVTSSEYRPGSDLSPDHQCHCVPNSYHDRLTIRESLVTTNRGDVATIISQVLRLL